VVLLEFSVRCLSVSGRFVLAGENAPGESRLKCIPGLILIVRCASSSACWASRPRVFSLDIVCCTAIFEKPAANPIVRGGTLREVCFCILVCAGLYDAEETPRGGGLVKLFAFFGGHTLAVVGPGRGAEWAILSWMAGFASCLENGGAASDSVSAALCDLDVAYITYILDLTARHLYFEGGGKERGWGKA
jgi:hypothetical protein